MEWRKPKISDILLVLALLLGNGFYWQYKSSELDRFKYDLSLKQFKENSTLEQEKIYIEKSKHMLELSKKRNR